MTPLDIAMLSVLAVLAFVYAGMHIAVALSVTSLIGIWAIKGSLELGTNLLALAAFDAVSGYTFGVIPLFVLMGLFVSVSDIGRDTFIAANAFLGRIRGGLGVATVAANAAFAAVTGISIASAAVFTRIAIPEMTRLGYRPRFAVGVVAGSSCLGMLIPPSLLMIIYGLLAEQSIGDLFIAGILPGLLLAAGFCVLVLGLAYLVPDWVQPGSPNADGPAEPAVSAVEALAMLAPLVALVFLVIGGIYAGWFTPTESGAVGALGAMLLALARRKLDWAQLWRVLVETGHITVSILILIIAANMYSRLIALSGLSNALETWLTGMAFGLFGLLTMYIVIVIILGTVLDAISTMLITLPMFLPLLAAYDVNLIYFGIVTVLAVEIGLLTPPLGLSVFVIKSTLEDQSITLGDIFIGAAPFAAVLGLVLLVVLLNPEIALALL
jgi:tripartite ATP-independent transporter DctM subunit